MAKSVNGGAGGGGGIISNSDDNDNDTTPICRCRVLYLGSAVPHITKDGLQGIQEPLRDLYPEQGVLWNNDRDHNATGIDSWLSVWSNGILVENVDDKGNTIRRFHPIESLHYCAAVRYVSVPLNDSTLTKNGTPNDSNKIAKFLPLDSPFSKSTAMDPMKMAHPPLFACILRRTSGIKVLECHAFICKKEAAANALVRCCFHAYADTMHAKQIELESPYEQLDRRRSRSIGSALDSQSLIDDKVNTWRKNSSGGGGESSTGSPDEANGFNDTRSISRQKQQQRTPSVASLVSHSMAADQPLPPPPPHLHPMMGMPEPIYGIPPTGTLRSVRSFISLAALKSHKKSRSRQIPMPFAHGLQPQSQILPPPPPPAPVMFATLSKKDLKKALKKESTLKRKHKYKDFPLPFIAANGYPAPPPPPFIYGPPPPLPLHGIHGPMPIYAPPVGPSFYGTIDNRKSRIPTLPPPLPPPPPPPPMSNMINDNGHMLPPPPPPPSSSHIDEPIYMPAVSSPNGTLRPVTPHGEPIYFEGRPGNVPPMSIHTGPPGPMYMGQVHPQMVPCSLIPTLSRKELKELEKQKALLKKQAKKDKKNAKKNKNQPQLPPQQMMNGNGQLFIDEPPPGDYYQPRAYGYEPNDIVDPDESIASPSEMQLSSGNYSNPSTGGGGGGIYKKKGHLNERAFSYSIRQEHRSRSNSLSNLAFENGPNNGHESQNNSSISLKSQTDANSPPKLMNGNGSLTYDQQQQQAQSNGNGRIPMNNNGPIDANALATRMSNLNLKNGYGGSSANQQQQQQQQPPPPPPPLPTNGYQQQQQYQQRTATIKRL